MKPGYDSRPRVPAATPKREAVRLRMFETTWWRQLVHVGDMCRTHACMRVRVGGTYLGVVLHTSVNNRADSQLPFLIHDEYDV